MDRLKTVDDRIEAVSVLSDLRNLLRKWNAKITIYEKERIYIETKNGVGMHIPLTDHWELRRSDLDNLLTGYYQNLRREYEAVKDIVEVEEK